MGRGRNLNLCALDWTGEFKVEEFRVQDRLASLLSRIIMVKFFDPRSDWQLISPNIITAESNVK